MPNQPEPAPEDPNLRIWMAEYQAGSIDAFDQLHRALASDLKGYLRQLSRDPARADDLLQETFLQLHRSRATHTPGQPVRPWVFTIAKRVFLMYRRTSVRRERHESLAAASDVEPLAADATQRLNAQRQVGRALQRVPPEGRRAFVLHHLVGFSFKEVGARLGIKAGAAKIRSSRAAALMRAWLREGRDE